MAQNSHNMAIFPHFLAFLVTFLVVRTTFMQLTSTERTQRPVTHAVWWCWTIWTIVKHSSGVGWVQNMAIFMAKTTPRWLGCSRLDRPTWKVSSGSYHTTMHGRVCLRVLFSHSRHLSRVAGVQKWQCQLLWKVLQNACVHGIACSWYVYWRMNHWELLKSEILVPTLLLMVL